ncbi:MAG: glycosyltransferase [Pseudomonadota bacterium]
MLANAPADDRTATSEAVGIVVIGRNEGAWLIRCLDSLAEAQAPIVYVDSGSDDGSPEAAVARGAEVVALDASKGFTAARARNAGLEALLGAHPDLRFVQFVDGDCEVVPGWLSAAQAALEAAPSLAAVAGRRRERFPNASIFNRLCDMEWNTPVGPARAVGGDAMYPIDALKAVGGFDPTLICGEEPELCLRLARAGWTVERLDRDMTLHDAAMSRWGQWAKRAQRSGWAFAEGANRYGDGPERYNKRQARSIWIWGAAAPAAILVAALVTLGLVAIGSALWPVPALLAVLGLAAYPAMAWRIARYRRAAHGDPPEHARLYGAMTMLAKFPQFLGVLSYRKAKREGRAAQIIEYKDVGAAKAERKGV